MEQADRIEHIGGDPAVVDALFLLRTTRKIRSNATLQVNNVIYETDYSLVGSTVQVRYEPDWIGQPHRKLPLYVDSIHVGGMLRLSNYTTMPSNAGLRVG